MDAIKKGEIQLVISTQAGKMSEFDDSWIRKNAVKYKIQYITTIAAPTKESKQGGMEHIQ